MILVALSALLSMLGMYISWRIVKKKQARNMVCYYGLDCVDVLSSKFSKYFGIDIERIGFVYYTLLFVGYALLLFSGITTQPVVLLSLFLASAIGVSFSVYLVFVQALYLKKWCFWCVSSVINSIVIFFLALASTAPQFGVMAVTLVEATDVLYVAQLIGVALGVSAATISGLLTINFLKDFKIDSHEDKKLTLLDQIVWLSISILIAVNICFYIIDPEIYTSSSQFLSQLFIFACIIVNNAFLTLHIGPKLIGMRIDMKSIHVFRAFWLRQIALALGVISVVSWYSILFTSFFIRITGDDLYGVISYYLATAIIAIIVSQFAILFVDKIKITRHNTYRFK